jgi:4-hydroxythreonine-4-phosphate dehydrogenase
MTKLKYNIRIGITMGDPSGIGPEITAKAVAQLKGLAQFVIIGDGYVFDKVAKSQSQKVTSMKFIDLNNVNHKSFSFGKIRVEYGRASMEYLDKAMELLEKKQIDCLVTCPISKEAINLAGFHFSGHTEYFSKKTKIKNLVMLLLNKDIRFSLVTRHIPLKKVAKELNCETISKTISATYKSLQKNFSIPHPRIAVCGINPHGSDNGIIGDEENRIIRPVLARLKSKLKGISGPLPADTAIAKAKRKEYDCVIAMYHDQALIPLKLLGDDTGVNMTLGLPFVRTSPLHGTAFDIAGKNKANPASLIASIKLALGCTLNQRKA